jgi:hypothetical protein
MLIQQGSAMLPHQLCNRPLFHLLLIMNEGEVVWAWLGGGGGITSTHGEGL